VIVALVVVLAAGWLGHLLIAAVPLDVAVWVAWLLADPFTNCGWCGGSGKHPLRTRKTFGRCWNPRCQRGTVVRLGARTAWRIVLRRPPS
jgi:hypothetical protein